MDPLKEPVWPDHFRAGDPHHVVSRMLPCSFTPTAEVVVVANHALVSKSCNRVLAPIASDPRMDHARLLLLLLSPLCPLESDSKLVDRTWHRGEGQHELLVSGDGDSVPILVSPTDREVSVPELRKHGHQLLVDVDEAGADVLVNDKPPDFLPLHQLTRDPPSKL